jgi:hypothetical protein
MYDDMQPDNTMNALPNGEVDREGAMAKADLYKLANYSLKLFKKVQDEDQMEAWVQAKITKAADYIASVYHYLEYEMKFSEYGKALDDSDVISESQKAVLKNRLMEAKSKVAELKKNQAEKMKAKDSKKVEEGILSGGEEKCTECGGTGMIYREATPVPDHVKHKVEKYKTLVNATKAAHKRMDANKNGIPDEDEMEEGFGDTQEKEMKVGDTKKTRTGELTKTSTGVIHKNTSYHDEGDEIASNAKSGKGIKSHAKAQSAAEKKDKAPAQKMSPKSAKTWGMKDSAKFDNRDKTVDETYGQGVYAEGKGDGNLANNAKPYDKVTRGDVIAGRLGKDEKGGKDKKVKEALKGGQKKLDTDNDDDIDAKDLATLRGEKKVDEASKPSAGLTKAQKSATVKDAKAGKDIGKPGKSFDKVAKAAGGGEKGEKIAAAAMWKNKAKAIKESLVGNQINEASDSDAQALQGLVALVMKTDQKNAMAAMEQGDEAFTKYLQDKLAQGSVKPDPALLNQEMEKIQAKGGTDANANPEANPEGQPYAPASGATETNPGEELDISYNAESINESSDFARMKQLMTRLNG